MINVFFTKRNWIQLTLYDKHIILKTNLSWDFDLVEFERTGGIS